MCGVIRFVVRVLALVVAVVPLLLTAQPNQCVELSNPSFEDGAVGWSVMPGALEIQNLNQRIVTRVPEGTQYIELANNSAQTVSQRVRTIPGALYELRLAYHPRPGYRDDNRFSVLWNKSALAAVPINPATRQWRYYSVVVSGGSTGQDLLELVDGNDPDGVPGAAALIDDVSLCRVRGLADGCCCGSNVVYAGGPYPPITWALRSSGRLSRLWWDQVSMEELIDPPAEERFTSGTLFADPFGQGAVVRTDKGNIAWVHRAGDEWSTSLVEPRYVQRIGGVLPCGLLATRDGRFQGVWAVTPDYITRFHREGGEWRYHAVHLGDRYREIDPTSLYESHEGQLAGVFRNGQRWAIWHEDGDPRKMRIDDWSGGDSIAVTSSRQCDDSGG